MFEQAMLASAPVGNRLLSTCAGVTGQVLLVGALILAPMIFPQVLPQVKSMVLLVAPGPPPPPPAPFNSAAHPRAILTTVRPTHCTFCVPITVPKIVDMAPDDPPEVTGMGVVGGVQGGGENGVPGGVLTSLMRAGAPPPAPPPQVRPVQQAVRQPQVTGPVSIDVIPGGRVRLAVPIHKVEPVYPPLARQARVSGTVQLEGIIGVDGHLRELRVISGPALLVKAAFDAVKQWVYAPTTLNEQPVEVIAPITVTFRLSN